MTLPTTHATMAVAAAVNARVDVELGHAKREVMAAVMFIHPDAFAVAVEREVAWAAARWAERELDRLHGLPCAGLLHVGGGQGAGQAEKRDSGDPGANGEWLAIGTPTKQVAVKRKRGRK